MRICRPALTLLVAAGCYSPTPPEGAACSSAGTCPDPLMCIAGTCVAQAQVGSDASAECDPIATGSGVLTAQQLTAPLAVDGDLSDWTACFVTLDSTNAGLVRMLGASQFPSGRFAVAADATHLYVGAEVTGVLPLGDHVPPEIYENNAISVYVEADGVPTSADYGAGGQIVVDHADRAQGFYNGGTAVAADIATAATTTGSTFTIELSVEPETFGVTSFAETIGFDIGLVGGDGSAMTSEVVWFQRCAAPQCGCSNGDSAPYCDARELGSVVLTP
jgi:hypothetical protein